MRKSDLDAIDKTISSALQYGQVVMVSRVGDNGVDEL
jgi:hypothetical protein